MNDFLEVLKYTVPSFVVLITAYFILKRFMDFNNKNLEVIKRYVEQNEIKAQQQLKEKEKETVIPLKLQAIERLVLFLERINPPNLVVREMEPGLTAGQFHKKLLNVVHQEYEHNITQQIYLSDEAWEMVKNAKEDIMSLLNSAAKEVRPQIQAVKLGEVILTKSVSRENDRVTMAISAIKKEMNRNFIN